MFRLAKIVGFRDATETPGNMGKNSRDPYIIHLNIAPFIFVKKAMFQMGKMYLLRSQMYLLRSPE